MKICLINGHPDPSPERFCSAIADAYATAARAAGHSVEQIALGELDVEFLNTAADFGLPPSEAIQSVQRAISDGQHLVIVYPLWMGTLPAKLKALIEQLARAGFFLDTGGDSQSWPIKKLKGRSVRLMVTMGMPGFAYRLFFGAHSLKGLEAGVFAMAGFKPVRHSIFGGVEMSAGRREAILAEARKLGQAGR